MIGKVSQMIGRASAPFLAKAAIAVGAVLVLLLTALSITGAMLLDARESLGAARQGKATAIATAENNHDAAVRLADRLSDEVNRRALDREAQERAQQRWETRIAQIQDDRRNERERRDQEYEADEQCQDLHRCVVCPGIADGLRDSRDRSRNRSGTGDD